MSEQLVADILKIAKQAGATAVEVVVDKIDGFSLRTRQQQIDTLVHNHDQSLDLTVYFDQRCGSVASTVLDKTELPGLVEKACTIARYTEPDPYSGLAKKELLAFGYPDLQLFHPADISIEQAVIIAQKCEAAARKTDQRITNVEGITVEVNCSHYTYGNSNGFIGSYPRSLYQVYCELVAMENGEKQRDYDFTIARNFAELEDVELVARRAAEKAVKRLGAKSILTGNFPVIFHRDVAKSLFGAFTAAISGGNLYRQASFLLNKLNCKIFPDVITIEEHPHLPGAIGSAPFDDEGVNTKAKVIVENGILTTYLLNSYSARKLNLETTGNAGGVYNLMVKHGDKDLATLIKEMGKGLLVTELIGQGVNIVTGDYSRGVFGYWVEHGAIQYPVHAITIAGNLQQMLMNIAAIANDVDNRGNIHTGSVLIDSMMIAGE